MKDESRSNITESENPGAGASMRPINQSGRAISNENSDFQIDDRDIYQFETARVLKRMRDELFDSSDENFALALGRSRAEVAEWLNGKGTLDGEALMKVRALARERK